MHNDTQYQSKSVAAGKQWDAADNEESRSVQPIRFWRIRSIHTGEASAHDKILVS